MPLETNLDSLDHIMMLSPSAAMATQFILERTGIEPEYGGEHVGLGTCNYLLSLGDNQYLEIVAPLENAAASNSDTEHELVRACRTLDKPEPYLFCVAAHNLDHLATILQDNDIKPSGPESMQRQRPDGVSLKWRLLTCFDNRFGTAFPFFIDWQDSEHPAKTSPGGCSLQRFTVGHPQHQELSTIFDALNLRIPVHESQTPRLDLVLSTPNGQVEL